MNEIAAAEKKNYMITNNEKTHKKIKFLLAHDI